MEPIEVVDADGYVVKLLKLGRDVDRSGTGTGGDALALHRYRVMACRKRG
jgi:hypothetical protein